MQLSPSRQRFTVASLLLLSNVILLGYWHHVSHNGLAIALLWNLFLAALPLLWGAGFKSTLQNRRHFLALGFFVLWLLFFPNAPYLLTDLIHLVDGIRLKLPPLKSLWLSLIVLLYCAGTGTMLGYLSLSDVHSSIEQRFGKAMGWTVVVLSLMLCGFGIYVGRFLRWNSWDALTRPLILLRSITKQFIAPTTPFHPVSITLIFATGLLLGYMAVRVIPSSASSQQ